MATARTAKTSFAVRGLIRDSDKVTATMVLARAVKSDSLAMRDEW
ncbi:MAG TPA: hypothetical protein PK019_11970 [Sedimentisphaerales bacterium]|nr:hypothetical protein [Sedimentisphaerales bacterium]